MNWQGIRFYINQKKIFMTAFTSKNLFLTEQILVLFKYKVISQKCMQHKYVSIFSSLFNCYISIRYSFNYTKSIFSSLTTHKCQTHEFSAFLISPFVYPIRIQLNLFETNSSSSSKVLMRYLPVHVNGTQFPKLQKSFLNQIWVTSPLLQITKHCILAVLLPQ